MNTFSRREFLAAAAVAPVVAAQPKSVTELFLAPFRFDVTPPMGHSLCGGWIQPVEAVDDPLEAIGFTLYGAGPPVVICAVDWTGLLNEAHVAWRTALAEAAGTTPDRVAVQTVHQHNAPFACLDAEKTVSAQKTLPHIIDLDFFKKCLETGRKTVEAAAKNPRRITHVATGQGRVEKVASNRRVNRDKNNNVLGMRGSSCKDAKLRAMPEGLIDPWLKTVAFYAGDAKVAACHYYACHPMSYYGDGRVTSDFAGLARKQRQKDEPNCHHIYFNGCGGNVAAGKYNDGAKENRPVLTKRLYDGLVASEANLTPEPIGCASWRTSEVLLTARADYVEKEIEGRIADPMRKVVERNRPSFDLAWLRRVRAKSPPIVLSALHINCTTILHLPAESFVEYQLAAQASQPGRFVATAAYGDDGPWYIPTKDEYPLGGYEVGASFVDANADAILTQGIRQLY